MPRTRPMDAATELAERLLQILESQRGQGLDSYPLTVQRLAELAEGQVTPELFARALKKKSFKERVALVKLDKTTSLVALAEDRALLAGDPRLLESALLAATPKKPAAQPVAKITAKVRADLREAFAGAVQRHIAQNDLPARIGVLHVDGTPRLFLHDRPPEVIVVARLATTLLQALEAERARGPDCYPATLKRLIERGAPQVPAKVIKKALAADGFVNSVVLAAPRNTETPLAFKEDLDQLAGSPQLLEFLLQCAAKPAIKAFAIKDLKKPLAENLRQPFVDAVTLNIERGKLPPAVGWLWIKTTHLFFVKDIHGVAGAESSTPRLVDVEKPGLPKTPAPATQTPVSATNGIPDFAAAFTAAFERLDHQVGGQNFVSLVELRRALPVPRAVFDAELFKLRQSGSFSVSAAEGRHGISPEEREAGIHEEGALLLFVSRNNT